MSTERRLTARPGSRGALAAMGLLTFVLGGCGTPEPAPDGPDPAAGEMERPVSTDTLHGSSLDVRLEKVEGQRPSESGEGRNPFRFGPAMPLGPDAALQIRIDPPPGSAVATSLTISPAPDRGTATLRFIGFVDAPLSAGLVAVITDGDAVFHGRENDVIGGRYRIVEIGIETVEIEQLQSGGRQVLRLSGS